jgi:MOSC domain-containing protein
MRSLARLCVTPLKGTRLRHPSTALLGQGGVVGNRRYYLVDDDGSLFSGSDHGPLVAVETDHDPMTDRLTLRFPDGTTLAAPAPGEGPVETTDFYGRTVRAREVPGPFAEALSSYAGQALRLFRTELDGEAVDVEPLTLVSHASVWDLAMRGDHPGDLDARRFRINLELGGCEPYEEDGWIGRRVEVGETVVRVLGQIPRCLVTTQDPETGLKDWNTLTQIARYRARIGGRGGLPFGVYARVEVPGPIRTGDPVTPTD